MANYASLKAAIQQVVKTNGNNEITGALLQQTLVAMVNSLGADYLFVDIAQPSTNPGTPDQNVFYLCGPGTYPNFNNLSVPDGTIGALKYNGSWSVQTLPVGKDYTNEIAEPNVRSVLNADAIGIQSHRTFDGYILSNNNWYLAANSTHYIIPIKPNDSIYIKGAPTYGTHYGLLKSYNFVTQNNVPADFCSGESRNVLNSNQETTIIAPQDAKFLYVSILISGSNYAPVSVLVNGTDPFYSKNLQQLITDANNNISQTVVALTELQKDVIINEQILLSGNANSNVVLRTPIILNSDGDNIEISVNTTKTGTASYSLSSNGNASAGYISVGIAQNRVSVRAYDGTWIVDGPIATGQDIIVKVVYASGKINVYVDGVLFGTYNGQKEIRITSFGNGANGNYGYWSGTIKYVKIGNEFFNLGTQTLNNVTTTKDYRFLTKEEAANIDTNPVGILTYNATGKYFIFYSKFGKTNKYVSFKIELDENNDDLVYLKEWRLSNGKLCEYNNGQFTEIAELIYDAENEMAMHLSGTIDYTGGIHGDERIDVSPDSFVKFFAGGKIIEESQLLQDFTIVCDTFEYMQFSTLHETSRVQGEFVAGHPIIATHYKHNVFSNAGSHLENIITFVSPQAVTVYHAGMFCVGKGAGRFAIMPATVVTPELVGGMGDYLATLSLPSRVDFWNPTTGVFATVEGDFQKGYNNETDIVITNDANTCGFTLWDRTTDSKYYRRTKSTKQFAAGEIIINTQNVQYKM
ncbi:MAG: hypothetical protein IKL37_01270 [Alphaproteobacteria bacterium]|nr:hypothetical protein [Alphaproteobacteria bacterium]